MTRPAWVRLSLWGITTRRSAMAFVYLSLAFAAGCGLYGFRNPRAFAGLGMIVAALCYWLAIRWVDQNDRWD